ncbi:MAG: PilZ domain-containing protein [Candidatus Scalindua sp.]
MYNDLKRRKSKKIEKPYMAGIQVKQHEGHETGWDSVTLHSLSVGGAFFIYKKDLGIGTLIDFKIEVSKSKPPLNPVGKVIRIDQFQLPPTSMFCIVIKFIDIRKKKKEAINTAVEKALKHHYQTCLA